MSSGVDAAARPVLDDHVVLLGVALVARDLAPAQGGLQRAGDHVHADAHVGRLLAVDIDAQLRLVQPQVHVHALDARVLADLVEHLARHPAQVLVAVGGLDHEVERPVAKALAERRRRQDEGVDPRQAAHLGLQLACDLQRGAVARLPVDRPVDHAALRHGRVAQAGEDAVELRVLLPQLLQHPRIAVGVVQRRAIRRVDGGQDGAAVFHRRELRLHGRPDRGDGQRAGEHDADHDPARLQQLAGRAGRARGEHPAQRARIAVAQRRQPALHAAVEPVRASGCAAAAWSTSWA